ncbi:MAG: alpha/beta fold hydrolase [Leptolyngbyaceae cyanobacterium MO_188.B28]|nr:alpha/beta fold hydrolase [Leptolyngbyaceae cyanobacterium MO_188.B28]
MQTLNASSPITLGCQRIWRWRGWRIRYTFIRPDNEAAAHAAPILLLHGFDCSLEQWRHNLSPLSAQHPVYAIDLLGFGRSQKAASPLDANLWAEQVYDFWRALIGRPVILLGHSMGALVAVSAAATHPDMVERLVMLTLPPARQEMLSGWVQSVAMAMERKFSSPLLIRPLFYFARRPKFIRAVMKGLYMQSEKADQSVVSMIVKPTHDRGAARTLCYLVKSKTDPISSPISQDLLAKVSVPTLLIWGEKDRVIPSTWGRKMAPMNPLVKLVELPDSGHFLYDEIPEQVNSLILDFSSPSHQLGEGIGG